MSWSLFLKNWPKLLAVLIFTILILMVQITFFGPESKLVFQFNLALVALVFFILLSDLKAVLFFSIFSGTVLDIYSGLPFGVFLLCFFLVAVILNFLFVNFFTNHSFYTLMFFGFLGILSYHFFFFLIAGLLYLIGWNDFSFSNSYWLLVLSQIVSALIIISFVFFVINRASTRFKPIFLRS